MNSKKILTIIIAVVIVAVIGFLVWKGIGNKTGSDSTVPTTENLITTDTTVAAVGGSIGKMTDAIFIEIAAQAAYYAQKDPAGWAARMEALYKKYGITEENMSAFSEALSNDPQRTAEFAQKYAQRLAELTK